MPLKALYSYRIASGWNVALGSLVNLELITQIGRPPTRCQPVNLFPIATEMLSNIVYGDGTPSLTWMFDSLPVGALPYILSTYLTTSSVLVKSKKVTIFTNLRDRGYYGRFNAYLSLPEPENDYKFDGNLILGLKLHFSGLRALS
jgi:hypothetical protein